MYYEEYASCANYFGLFEKTKYSYPDFSKEDIPKKINFKSRYQKTLFKIKIINSISGHRGRNLRKKQSSIYK